jgi:hypothetical protein
MRLVGAVELPLADVMALLGQPGTDGLLEAALAAAPELERYRISLRCSPPQRVGAYGALMPLAWHAVDEQGRARDGDAWIQLVVVQSGRAPHTELVLSLSVADAVAPGLAAALHRFLDDVASRLTALAAA